MLAYALHLSPPGGEHGDGPEGTRPAPAGFPAEADDLAYKVEVWDEAGAFVEQVVAISVSAAIGYAAYYAATREYPGRDITLRHRKSIVSRWNGRTH